MKLILALVFFVASTGLFGCQVLNLRSDLKASGKQVKALDKEINDPATGLKPKLAQCEWDRDRAQAAVATQSHAVASWAAKAKEAEARGRAAMKAAEQASKDAERKIAASRSAKPKSSEFCAQARELEADLRGTVKS